ncbi:hypothetical protein F4825DRAFT_429456 [Nemania diffusa]|nr:hypothetical protein F4825DRAFT_429456 [Nemania diffusa]
MVIATSSYKNNMPTWKSSLMPLLFHGVEEWSDDEIRNIRQGGLEDKGVCKRRQAPPTYSLSGMTRESRGLEDWMYET